MKINQTTEAGSPRTGKRLVRPPKTSPDRPATAKTKAASLSRSPLDSRLREQYIRTAAYYLAEHRGFAQNHEVEDWLAAEAEVDERLA